MEDFSFWWYIIAAVLYFLTNRKKKKQTPTNPNRQDRPQRSEPPKSFEDLLREITEGPSQASEAVEQEPVEVNPQNANQSRAREAAQKKSENARLEGERRHFADEESKKIYEESIKMAEGADLDFRPAEAYREPSLLRSIEIEEEEDEWTIADEIRDGLTTSEARKAVIYSEILNRKY